jgi:hypothetical protein
VRLDHGFKGDPEPKEGLRPLFGITFPGRKVELCRHKDRAEEAAQALF